MLTIGWSDIRCARVRTVAEQFRFSLWIESPESSIGVEAACRMHLPSFYINQHMEFHILHRGSKPEQVPRSSQQFCYRPPGAMGLLLIDWRVCQGKLVTEGWDSTSMCAALNGNYAL